MEWIDGNGGFKSAGRLAGLAPLALLWFGIGGCNDTSPALNPVDGAGGVADLTSAPWDGGDMAIGPGLQVGFTITDSVSKMPLTGVQVCVYPNLNPCGTTDNQGIAQLHGVPSNSEVAFSLVLATYQDELLLYTTGTGNFMVTHGMLLQSTIKSIVTQQLGVALDLTRGLLHLSTTNVVGVTFAITPTTTMVEQGPYYTNSMGSLDKSTMATSNPNDDAIYVNLPAGDVDVWFIHMNGCTPTVTSWAGSAASKAKALMVPGYLTHTAMDCNH